MSERTDGRNVEIAAWTAAAGALVLAPIAHLWLDRGVADWAFSNRLVESQLLQWTTEIGESTWWLVPSAIVFALAALRKRRNLARWAFAMFVAVAASGLLANAAKYLVGKTRPKVWFESGEFGFHPLTYGYEFNSMPSGHATTAGAVAIVLALAFPRVAPLILPLGVALALTRVAIHAHYLSDVLAGLALGASCALATFAAWRRRWPSSVPIAGASGRSAPTD